MLVGLLIFVLLFPIFIYSIVKVVHSYSKESRTVTSDVIDKEEALEAFMLLSIFGFIFLGYTFNNRGVAGGSPLHIYEMTEKPMAGYASLSNSYTVTIFVCLLLSLFAYWLLTTKMGKLSPIVYVVCSSLLLVNILFTLVYLTHTGIEHYVDSIDTRNAIFCLQFGYASLSLLYIAKLNDSLKQFLEVQQERHIHYTNPILRSLSWISLKYRQIPVLGMLFLFPLMIVLQFILVLLGQRPDSFIQVFLDTSNYNYSKMPVPPPEIISGDGHYLCTVSAMGHKKLVKPVRSGIRHGERIIVNRQLLIANAFENVLEEYTPRLHERIRLFYDAYGYPVSQHIQTQWSADFVYLLMKPLEWFFLFVLYTVDRNPENRIHVQYSELRRA